MSLVALLQESAPALITVCLLLGLMVGSFLNVVIYRLPKMMERQWREECAELAGNAATAPTGKFNLIVPRSRCPSCDAPIPARHNVPVLSYVVLGGKCSACGWRIPARYPFVEALTGLLSGYTAWRFGFTAAGLAALFFVWAMVALSFIDLDTFFLPDDITLPLLWSGLLVNLFGVFTDLQSAVIGAASGYLILWSIYWLFKLATGKEGMGYGDFKLLAAIGAWLGWKMLPAVILLSSVVGAIIGVVLMVMARRGRDVPIPFGPYLAIAGLIALFHGEALNRHYLNLF
jgi:leader peptidase (prepilin peptidase)/N-methyltransferase